MSDSQRLRAIIEGDARGAVRAFDQATDGAERMGRDVDRAAKQSGRSLEDFERRATAAGAALGALAAASSVAGRAHVDEARELDALRRAYGDLAPEIIDFTEAIQDQTNFSNDAAREAALLASTLTDQYGVSIEQTQAILARTADLAELRGISFEDAAQRVTAAIRGEAESAEFLGLVMNDASLGIDRMAKSTTNAEKAAIRVDAFMEQSSFATGAAGDAADTTRGQMIDLGHAAQDLTADVGGMLGPVGEATAVFGDLALGLPLVAAGLGRVAAGAGGTAAALARLGPLALASGAALGAGFLTQDVLRNFDEAGSNAADSFGFGFLSTATGILKKLTPTSLGDEFFDDVQRQYNEILRINRTQDVLIALGFELDTDQADEFLDDLGHSVDEIDRIAQQSGQDAGQIVLRMAQEAGFVVDDLTGKLVKATDGSDEMTRALLRQEAAAHAAASGNTVLDDAVRHATAGMHDYEGDLEKITAFQEAARVSAIGYAEALGVLPDFLDAINRAGGQGLARGTLDILAGVERTTSALATGHRVIVANTEAIGETAQATADWATELITVTNSSQPLLDLMQRGQITQTTYNRAISATTDILTANDAIQNDLLRIQAKQLPILGDLARDQARYVDSLADMHPEAQLVALGFQDAALAAQAQQAVALAASAAMGELGTNGKQAATAIIEGAVAANPILGEMLEEINLISRDHEGNLTINFPEATSLQSNIDGLTSSIDRLTRAIDLLPDDEIDIVIRGDSSQLADVVHHVVTDGTSIDGTTWTAEFDADPSLYFQESDAVVGDGTALDAAVYTPDIEADGTGAHATLADVEGRALEWEQTTATATVLVNDGASGPLDLIIGRLNALDGRTATSYVDTIHREFSIGQGGIGFTAFQHGGVVGSDAAVPYDRAQHGAVTGGRRVLVGEGGPEIATLPAGALITPNQGELTARGRPRAIAVNLHVYGNIYGVDDVQETVRGAIRSAMLQR